MKLLFAFLLPLLVNAVEKPKDMEPAACSSYGLPSENWELYHGDHTCNRADYNQFKKTLSRGSRFDFMKKSHEINRVPNQKTVICPLEVEDLVQKDSSYSSTGLDTVWFVENTSTESVVLSYVSKQDGIEYSAIHPTITPPQRDPQAFLEPGRWRALYVYEGHVFHARSFDPESGNLGPVVMQHRAGLIPVGAHAQDMICPPDDPEPVVKVVEDTANPVRDPAYARTPVKTETHCHTIDIGFRNLANCPLHGYFITAESNVTCQEGFKFHLGLNRVPDDFFWQWDSATKFESSFIGHSFAFRSAFNPSILVETVTLQPSRIVDCPNLKQKAQINHVTTVGELQDVFLPLSNQGEFSQHDQFKDSLVHMDRHVMAEIFNDTMAMNATSTMRRSVYRAGRSAGSIVESR